MKNILILLLTLFMLAGCSKQELQIEPSKSINEITEKFIYETGEYLVDGIMVEFSELNRDDELIITNEDDDYYYVSVDGVTVAIEKKYVRTENDEPFVQYTGYTKKGSSLYSDYEQKEEIESFSLNDNVKVLDEFADVLFVEYNGKTGYMKPSSVSKDKIKEYVAPKPTQVTPTPGDSGSSSDDDDHHSSGGGGGDSGGGGDDSGGGGDSSDISWDDLLSNVVFDVTNIADKNYINGIVLKDRTTTYITVSKRNNEVHVTGSEEDNYLILVDGHVGKIAKKYVRLDSEEEYKKWDGYSKSGSKVYSDFDLSDTIDTYKTNDVVKIIDEVDGVLVVELEDGSYGYIKSSNVSKEKNKTYVAPKPTEVTTPGDSGGSSGNDDHHSSGGGDSGGGGGDSGGGGGDSGGGGGDSGGGGGSDDGFGEDHL